MFNHDTTAAQGSPAIQDSLTPQQGTDQETNTPGSHYPSTDRFLLHGETSDPDSKSLTGPAKWFFEQSPAQLNSDVAEQSIRITMAGGLVLSQFISASSPFETGALGGGLKHGGIENEGLIVTHGAMARRYTKLQDDAPKPRAKQSKGTSVATTGGLTTAEQPRARTETTLVTDLFAPIFTCYGYATHPVSGDEGLILWHFNSARRAVKTFVPFSLIARPGSALLEHLAARGFRLPDQANPEAQKLLRSLLSVLRGHPVVSQRVPGWLSGSLDPGNVPTFVAGSKVIVPDGMPEARFYIPEELHSPTNFGTRGNLKGWQDQVAILAQGNSRAILALCVSLAGPLLTLAPSETRNGLLNFVGESSSGKTKLLQLGGSVWGGSESPTGFGHSWAGTRNGIVSLASLHNGTVFVLDEAQLCGGPVQQLAYTLSLGQDRVRMTADLGLAARPMFGVWTLSAGERGIAELVERQAKVEGEAMSGLTARAVDIPASSLPFRAFENAHGMSGEEFARHLSAKTREHYGHAGPEMVRAVMRVLADRGREDIEAEITDYAKEFVDELGLSSDTAEVVRRLAFTFGVFAYVGALAVSAKVLPACIDRKQIDWAIQTCFADWRKARPEGVGSTATAHALVHLRDWLSVNRNRFCLLSEQLSGKEDEPASLNNVYDKSRHAGYVRIKKDGAIDYLIDQGVWRSEIEAKSGRGELCETLWKNGLMSRTETQNRAPQYTTRINNKAVKGYFFIVPETVLLLQSDGTFPVTRLRTATLR